MASETTNPVSVVIDASVVIALCAKEADKIESAETKLLAYSKSGCDFYAPGVLIAECLFVFCRKLQAGELSPEDHGAAVGALEVLMSSIKPPPVLDASLVKRAEHFRGGLGCARSADGIYLAYAEALGKSAGVAIVTFDQSMKTQAASHGLGESVVVLPVG